MFMRAIEMQEKWWKSFLRHLSLQELFKNYQMSVITGHGHHWEKNFIRVSCSPCLEILPLRCQVIFEIFTTYDGDKIQKEITAFLREMLTKTLIIEDEMCWECVFKEGESPSVAHDGKGVKSLKIVADMMAVSLKSEFLNV